MPHTHNHPAPCEHELAWCKPCAVPYCTKCGKEWAEKSVVAFKFKGYEPPAVNPPLTARWRPDPSFPGSIPTRSELADHVGHS